jgi:hypothetical protein
MSDFKGTATRRASTSTSIQYRVSGSVGLTTIYVNVSSDETNWGEYAPNTARLWVTPADLVTISAWGASFLMCLSCNGAEVSLFTCTTSGQSIAFFPRPAAVASAEIATAAFA